MPIQTRRIVAGAVAAAVGQAGCRCDPEVLEPKSLPASQVEAEASQARQPERVELTDHIERCDVFHGGLVIDAGSHSAASRQGYGAATAPRPSELVDRMGSRFVKISDRRVSYDFWLPRPQSGIRMRARLHGGSAARLTAYVDDHRMGSARLSRDETQTVNVDAPSLDISSGRHRITLHFWRPRPTRSKDAAYAELDWINIGDPGQDLAGTYEAPTARSMLVDMAIDGRPRRSVVLRAPSTVRCPLLPSPNTKLRVSLGFWGNGSGKAEVRFRSDSEPNATIETRRVRGGPGATWVPVELDLTPHALRLGSLEFVALDSSPAGQVVFGDPTLVRQDTRRAKEKKASFVVIIVAAGLDRRRIPPWGPTGGLAALGELSRHASALSGYRIPTTVPAGVMASLLTGLPPHLHGVDQPSARLPLSIKLLSTLIKESGGRAALFTGVPSTFPAFGFNSGWDKYEALSPVRDVSATAPIEHATDWLRAQIQDEERSPTLLVVHTRGAHPPWDLTRDEVRMLPPQEYSGTLDARRGGITLAKVRGYHSRRHRRLTRQDWVRLHALMDRALEKQSRALGRLMDLIDRSDAWNETLLVFAGDVAVGDPPAVPFDPAGPLEEDRLAVPLLIRFPEGTRSGVTDPQQVSTTDLAVTALDALGLSVPEWMEGVDLQDVVQGIQPLLGRSFVATLQNHYATRLGGWLLQGQLGSTPKLCRTHVDPACVSDLFDEQGLAARALWFETVRDLSASEDGLAPQREPANLDPDTVAALTVTGSLP